MENVTIIDHPLVQHKISRLRDKNTGTNEFRTLIEEIATLMGYEALRDLPLEEVEVETPLERCMTPVIAGKKLAIVPILRAGLGMVNGILSLVPTAKVGHIGLYRDEKTHEPHEYYCKLPSPIEQRTIVVTDPMLASGGVPVALVDCSKSPPAPQWRARADFFGRWERPGKSPPAPQGGGRTASQQTGASNVSFATGGTGGRGGRRCHN